MRKSKLARKRFRYVGISSDPSRCKSRYRFISNDTTGLDQEIEGERGRILDTATTFNKSVHWDLGRNAKLVVTIRN